MTTDEILPVIPGYSQFKLIGTGGSAVVYRAVQEQLERYVAIKVLQPDEIDDRTRELFDVERRVLGQMPKRQNIVTVFDSGFTYQGDPYLVMELCPSGSVAQVVSESGPLSLELSMRVGARIMDALDFAHSRGMIHRDVKPENILISDLGEPVLSDFGIASLLDQDGSTTERAFSPHHVAPEVLRGAIPGVGSDLYSLGSSVFSILVGHAPHQLSANEELQLHEVLYRVADPRFIPEIPASIDTTASTRHLIKQLLEKDPTRRISTAKEALELFQRIESELGTDRRKLSLPTVPFDGPEFGSLSLSSRGPGSLGVPSVGTGSIGIASTGNASTGIASTGIASIGVPAPGTVTAPPSLVRSSTSRSGTSSSNGGMSRSAQTGRAGSVSLQSAHEAGVAPARVQVPDTSRPIKNQAVLAVVAAVVLLLAIFAVVQQGKPSPAPLTSVAAEGSPDDPAESLIRGLTKPRNVQVVTNGTDLLSVTWDPQSNPNATYELTVKNQDVIVVSKEGAVSPQEISAVGLSNMSPCVQVTVLDPETTAVAESDWQCNLTSTSK
jgi:serine/threonine protein kinase